jgi:thermitase
VVAAGNDGESIESHPEYPASYTEGNILTVAATDANSDLASFSNYGSNSVDLAAPGDQVYSTYPTSSYRYLSGTSMAAPFVAAAAAMLRKQDPDLSYSDLRSALKASVDPVAALAKKTVTGGRLNLAKALQRVR